MTEELALLEILRNRTTVDGDERFVLSQRQGVKRSSDELLSGSAFTRDEDGRLVLSDPVDHPKNVLHRL